MAFLAAGLATLVALFDDEVSKMDFFFRRFFFKKEYRLFLRLLIVGLVVCAIGFFGPLLMVDATS